MPVRPSSPFRKLQSVRARTAAASLMVAGSLALTLLPAAQASTPVTHGYRDYSFGGESASEPTAEKPESKLWYNDGFWWASMFDPTNPGGANFDSGYYIYKLNPATQEWSPEPNRTSLDSRNSSKADTLWDGTKLYVASHIEDGDALPSKTGPGNEKRFYRYSYNAGSDTYTLDSGFSTPTGSAPGGAIIAENSSETLTLAKETTAGGKLWVTWTEADMVDGDLDPTTPPTAGPVRVKVAYSTTGGTSWTPMNLPVTAGTADNLTLDDISTIVAFNNRIGVMWSNQTTRKTYFAVHADASDPALNWGSAIAVYDAASGDASDDHLNIKVQADSAGRLYAVTKTGFSGEGRDDIVLLACTNGTCGSAGNWSRYTVYTVPADTGDEHTRPILLIDNTTGAEKVHIFTTQPTTGGPSAIYKKSVAITGLSNTTLAAAPSVPFIQSATDTNINNATTTKQTVNASTGLVVLASDNTTDYYLHNYDNLVPPTVTTKTPADGATGVALAANISATFSERVTVSNGTFTVTGPGGAVAGVVTFDDASNTATFDPTADLLPNTTYTATLTTGIVDETGTALVAPVTWSFTTGAGPDIVPPTVTGTSPTAGATGVVFGSDIAVTFSEPVLNVSETTFTVTGPGGAVVSGEITFDALTNTYTFNPDVDFAEATTYTVTLTGGITDQSGNALVPVTFTFTSQGTTFPFQIYLPLILNK